MSEATVKRYAIVSMGVRFAFYYQAIINDFKDTAKVVGICDTNQTRMNAANDRMAELGAEKVPTYRADDFDAMVKEQRAETWSL